MGKRSRKFINGECNHVYQRTVGGVNLFYDLEDFLVFYMIVSVTVKKHGVRLLSMCLMIDHIHLLLLTDSLSRLADFVRDYSSIYAREFNASVGRKGQLFDKSYGSAPKKGDKRTRSTNVYIGNNPVEKKLCAKAEDYRWNFLKYVVCKYPFSRNMPVKKYSRPLSRAIKIVGAASRSLSYLNYTQLYKMFSDLQEFEKEILADCIISIYYPFDDAELLRYYDSYEQMLDAMHSTSGAEYDIREMISQGSDMIYWEMIKYLKGEFPNIPVRSHIMLPDDQKLILLNKLRVHTGATVLEASKFLHLKIRRRANS